MARSLGPEALRAQRDKREKERLEAEQAERRRVFIVSRAGDINAFNALSAEERDRAMKEHRVRQR